MSLRDIKPTRLGNYQPNFPISMTTAKPLTTVVCVGCDIIRPINTMKEKRCDVCRGRGNFAPRRVVHRMVGVDLAKLGTDRTVLTPVKTEEKWPEPEMWPTLTRSWED